MKIAKICLIAIAALLAAGIASAGTPCDQPSVYSVDPANADTSAIPIFGESWGEVVPVNDVLVRAVTFYGPPTLVDFGHGSLYITQVDATGKPLIHSIVFGPSNVIVAAGDGVTPSHFDFTFDSPITLPALGAYDFALKEENCGSGIAILAVKIAPHEGHAWETGRNCSPGLGSLSFTSVDPIMDLAMRIEFCSSGATPAVHGTWGRVKTIYR